MGGDVLYSPSSEFGRTPLSVPTPGPLRILMALVFYPRGGSAQVVRYLARALTDLGHTVQIVSGSLKGSDPTNDAATFFRGLQLMEVDYTEAARGFDVGLDPMSDQFSMPFHPSYEDKPGVPDRAFYRVDRHGMRHLVASWRRVLSRALQGFRPNVVHLHHLNHLHLAALSLPQLSHVPKVAHLHGTELKMLEDMRARTDDPDGQIGMWDAELRRAAAGMQHFIAISPDNVRRAMQVLGVKEESISFIPNGVDVYLFRPRNWSTQQKLGYLEDLLVRSPRGWNESGVVGSVRYDPASLTAFLDGSGGLKPLFAFAGRFLDFKRLPLLLEAVAQASHVPANERGGGPAFNVLILGGVPGEWEGEHPHTIAERLELSNVFFCGWLPHEELAEALNLADVLVAPSYYEPFGQVYLEAMATGLPVIATRSGGPLSFVIGEGGKANGWLSDVDDVECLAQVIAESASNESERMRRGRNALEFVRANHSWSTTAVRFEALYRHLVFTRRITCR
jgi:glycosyltransferase involved in cell wall biosynthesis